MYRPQSQDGFVQIEYYPSPGVWRRSKVTATYPQTLY
jgi:hypothetical protein